MDIRTKAVFALVAVALGSMLALGLIMSAEASKALEASRVRQLEALADSKEEGLDQVVAGWRDRVRLVASRTQLRQSLREHLRGEGDEPRLRMGRILADALEATQGVESIEVRDPEGRSVVAVSRSDGTESLGGVGLSPASPDGGTPGEGLDVPYEGVSFQNGGVQVGFRAALVLEGETVGSLHLRLSPTELFDLAALRTGLGDTGETLIVLRGADRARVIRPPSADEPRLSGLIDPLDAPDPVRLALEGREDSFVEAVTDAGGDAVWAVVRRLQLPGWGLVVKVDAEQGRRPVTDLRDTFTDTALALAAFAILAGTLLGFRFAQPILDLSGVANRIREGELDARATVRTHDEVGLLARTFNQMADELEERMTELREFHTFFEVSLDLLCIAATDGYFKRVNPAFERTLGWSPETLLSRPIVEFVHPDDREATAREIERLAEGVPTISFENRFRHADGSYRLLRWTSHPEPETGLLYAVARDVTGGDRVPSGGPEAP